VGFHVTIFDGKTTERKSPESARDQRSNLFFSPEIARHERRAINGFAIYRRCFETSLVISNILTWLLPLNTGLSESSALIMVRFFLSWQPCFLM
jgi:hypothetical protein